MLPQVLDFYTLFSILLQTAMQKVCHLLTNQILLLNNILFVEHVKLDFCFVLSNEVAYTEQNLMGNHTQRPHIHLTSICLALEQFGRHVGIGTHLLLILSRVHCKPKITYLINEHVERIIFSNENILGFEIPMTYVVHRQVVQRSDDLDYKSSTW